MSPRPPWSPTWSSPSPSSPTWGPPPREGRAMPTTLSLSSTPRLSYRNPPKTFWSTPRLALTRQGDVTVCPSPSFLPPTPGPTPPSSPSRGRAATTGPGPAAGTWRVLRWEAGWGESDGVMSCDVRSPAVRWVRWRWARRPTWIASQCPASHRSLADRGGCRPGRTLSQPDLPEAPLPPPPPAHTDHWEDPSAGLINRVRPHPHNLTSSHPHTLTTSHPHTNIFIFRFLPVPRQRYCSLDPLTWREETNISYLIIICQSLCDWYHHNVLSLSNRYWYHRNVLSNWFHSVL